MNIEQITKIQEILIRQGKTLSVAESLTSGNLQAAFASISGSSEYFKGGMTAYSLGQKVKHLGVDKEHAEKVNCVSQRVANQMARGISKLFQTDIEIATTGYAEKYEGVEEPYAFYCILDHQEIVKHGKIKGKNINRIEMQHHVTDTVIDSLYNYLKH